MALILFDTNIFIDMLNGVREATVELGIYNNPAISIITYMELRATRTGPEKVYRLSTTPLAGSGFHLLERLHEPAGIFGEPRR